MDYCAVCGCDITELGSKRCLGFACDKRLCPQCFSESGGYCLTCAVRQKITDRPMVPGSLDTTDELYEELDEMYDIEAQLEEGVKVKREREKEQSIKDAEEREKRKKEEFEKDQSKEAFILRKIRELNREMEIELREKEEDEEDEE
jgi:hypothetical protein